MRHCSSFVISFSYDIVTCPMVMSTEILFILPLDFWYIEHTEQARPIPHRCWWHAGGPLAFKCWICEHSSNVHACRFMTNLTCQHAFLTPIAAGYGDTLKVVGTISHNLNSKMTYMKNVVSDILRMSETHFIYGPVYFGGN